MLLHFLHQFIAFFLFATVFSDAFFLRSKRFASFLSDSEFGTQLKSWRLSLALLEMGLFIVVFGLGITLWMPQMQSLNPMIFHTKLLLAVAFLGVAKIRMFKDRKSQDKISLTLTRIMFVLLILIVLLGLTSSRGLF